MVFKEMLFLVMFSMGFATDSIGLDLQNLFLIILALISNR